MCDWKVIVPEATANLFSNPSLEIDTTGFAAVSANSIAQADDQSFKGDHSLEMTYGDSDTMVDTAAFTLTAVPHTFNVWVYIPATWDGGAISLALDGFAGATIQTPSNSTAETGKWVELSMTFTPAGGDLTGTLQIITALFATAGRVIYGDAFQLEAKAYSTTYCDGDQEGCSWDGTPHASPSRRAANSRAGGRVMDFEDDYGFRVQAWPGAGFGAVDNQTSEHTTLPGGEFQRARLTSRTFILSGTIIGDTADDLKAKRAALIPILSPFAYDLGPVALRYTGDATDKQIRARYAGGLEWDKVMERYEQVSVIFWAEDPRYLALGENSAELSTDTLTTRLILGKIGGEWSALGPPAAPGTAVYTSIRDIKVGPDGRVYVCGVFSNFDNIANADCIAAYDPIAETWAAVGAPGAGATLTSILQMTWASNGHLYVVGDFRNLAGVADADAIARWTGSAWEAAGTPGSGATITDVRAVSAGWGARVWVGGDFTNLAGVAAADYIAYYDIVLGTWAAVGAAGANAYVSGIHAETHENRVYATGNFTSIDGVAAARVAVREAGTWQAMGSGLNSNGNRILSAGGTVYVVGNFTTAGSAVSPGAAFWNGEKWQPMAAGLDDPAHALAQLATGEILIGGSFDAIVTVLGSQEVEAEGAAYWNGSIWRPPEFDLPGADTVTVYAAAAAPNGDYFIGYDQTGDTIAPAANVLTNNGTAPAWPVFVLELVGGAPSPLVAIENVTTGKKLTFSYEMEPGRLLIVDTHPKRFGMYHADGVRFFRFRPDSDPAAFVLRPGENKINIYIEYKSGATSITTVRWVDSYESVDG